MSKNSSVSSSRVSSSRVPPPPSASKSVKAKPNPNGKLPPLPSIVQSAIFSDTECEIELQESHREIYLFITTHGAFMPDCGHCQPFTGRKTPVTFDINKLNDPYQPPKLLSINIMKFAPKSCVNITNDKNVMDSINLVIQKQQEFDEKKKKRQKFDEKKNTQKYKKKRGEVKADKADEADEEMSNPDDGSDGGIEDIAYDSLCLDLEQFRTTVPIPDCLSWAWTEILAGMGVDTAGVRQRNCSIGKNKATVPTSLAQFKCDNDNYAINEDKTNISNKFFTSHIVDFNDDRYKSNPIKGKPALYDWNILLWEPTMGDNPPISIANAVLQNRFGQPPSRNTGYKPAENYLFFKEILNYVCKLVKGEPQDEPPPPSTYNINVFDYSCGCYLDCQKCDKVTHTQRYGGCKNNKCFVYNHNNRLNRMKRKRNMYKKRFTRKLNKKVNHKNLKKTRKPSKPSKPSKPRKPRKPSKTKKNNK